MTEILPGHSPDKIDIVRALWSEYWTSVGLDGDFQGFEAERRGLPGAYAPPGGALLLAVVDGEVAATGAFRPLSSVACEAKRFYVRPAFRGSGLAAQLLQGLMRIAQESGYRVMYADTLPSMSSALRLYDRHGFRRTGPYSAKPTPGAVYLYRSL